MSLRGGSTLKTVTASGLVFAIRYDKTTAEIGTSPDIPARRDPNIVNEHRSRFWLARCPWYESEQERRRSMPSPITSDRYDAVLFDMDGVVTDTARIHAVCWKAMFDEFLKRRGTPDPPFDLDTDYKSHVDGKPRYQGVRDFLKSRDITLPEGTPDDPPTEETVCGLGNRKNQLFNERVAMTGVEPYAGSIAFLEYLRRKRIKRALVSSSHNTHAILQAAGVEHFFDIRVDDEVLVAHGLRGKPAPDSFLKAAEMLEVEPARAVVLEDAISGIRAGVAGGFALVIGVARHGNVEELHAEGAHEVVADLAELLPQS